LSSERGVEVLIEFRYHLLWAFGGRALVLEEMGLIDRDVLIASLNLHIQHCGFVLPPYSPAPAVAVPPTISELSPSLLRRHLTQILRPAVPIPS
jgi:hypothetical protein